MEIITLPRLKIAELQSLTASTLKICEPLTEVDEQIQKVETEFTSFKEGMLKNIATANGKKTIDKERDRYNSGFFFDIRSQMYYPYEDPAAQSAVDKLKELSKKYGSKINKLPFNEETAAIDNCMAEAEAIDLTPLSNTSIARWIPIIKDANQRFKDVANEFVEKSAAAASLESASAAAPELVHAIEQLYLQIFALLRVNPNHNLIKAYSELGELVDSYW
jgi:DNA repair exonuclease SbcCD ATPase subunit